MASDESLLLSDALNNKLGVLSSIVKQQHEVQWGGLVGFLKIGENPKQIARGAENYA